MKRHSVAHSSYHVWCSCNGQHSAEQAPQMQQESWMKSNKAAAVWCTYVETILCKAQVMHCNESMGRVNKQPRFNDLDQRSPDFQPCTVTLPLPSSSSRLPATSQDRHTAANTFQQQPNTCYTHLLDYTDKDGTQAHAESLQVTARFESGPEGGISGPQA
jgi:hypothetical protein